MVVSQSNNMKHSLNKQGDTIVAHSPEEMQDFQDELSSLDIPKSKTSTDFGKHTISALSRMKKGK